MDIIELRDFYSTSLGRVARKIASKQLRLRWPDIAGETVLGFGYATPYLRRCLDEAAVCMAFMPAGQGVARWPMRGPNKAILTEETGFPLPDGCIDRVLAVHGLELAPNPNELCREFWRVLKPGGRVLIMVPNRRGLWARAESTPFGHGRPFSRGQLSLLLKDSLFAPDNWGEALFVPPLRWRPVLRGAGAWEQIGAAMWPGFSGLTIVEAVKDVYGITPVQEARKSRARLRPIIAPVPAVPHRAHGER
ncbi:MAG: methyltransferase type 11 [Hyphomicrobiales bacterium]|nr:MAG: methyltransferase type 11 [Hyphomicrobiales bacterium]